MKYWIGFFCFLVSVDGLPQSDTQHLKTLYDRCLDFSEDKADSIKYYAGFIESKSRQLKFQTGAVLSLRLKGLAAELHADYQQAVDFYLQSLVEARKVQRIEYEIAALSDLAIVYSKMKQPQKAKEFYLQNIPLVKQRGELEGLVNAYNNVAVIYSQLGYADSALFYLNEALKMAKQSQYSIDLSSTYNNLGNEYFKKKEYSKAKAFFVRNYVGHLRENGNSEVWVDHLNLADVYIEQKNFDSARWHANKALDWALYLKGKDKEADSYAILAKLYERLGETEKAYAYLKKWYALDTSIVNAQTNKTVAELQERFHARQREADNKLLTERVAKENYRNQSITALAVALGAVAVLSVMAFITKRNANRKLKTTNDLVLQKNVRLAELNHEKNSLISIVSHDLSAPFSAVHTWAQVLQSEAGQLSADQQKAINKIIQAGTYGQDLIKRILDVEKAEATERKVQLENFNVVVFLEQITDGFKPLALQKGIHLHVEKAPADLYLLSDRQMVRRVCENLLSNAIKYTPPGKNVWIRASDNGDAISISVRDEGVGIAREELPQLFSKYSHISSQPTGGEPSTGLGLSIVKRIVDELNGKIFGESEPGKGSLFTVVLKK